MSDITERLTEYLVHGGLYNSELMQHNKVRDLLIDCRAEIARLREERRWVPVGERLPEVWTEVLFLERQEYVDEHGVVSRGIVMACLTDDHEISSNCDLHQPFHSVTHWQPLPPGPEGNR